MEQSSLTQFIGALFIAAIAIVIPLLTGLSFVYKWGTDWILTILSVIEYFIIAAAIMGSDL